MSIRATNHVRRLRGLTPSEKAVAFILADHDDHKGGGSYPSVATVAEEAGFAFRQNASDIVQALADKNVIVTDEPSKGGRPTRWYFNYDLTGCAQSIHLAPINRSRMAAVNRSPATAVQNGEPQSDAVSTAVGQHPNRSRKRPEPQPRDCRKGLEGLMQRQGVRQGGESRSPQDIKERYAALLAKYETKRPEIESLVQNHLISLRCERLDHANNMNFRSLFDSFSQSWRALGLNWQDREHAWNLILHLEETMPPLKKPK